MNLNNTLLPAPALTASEDQQVKQCQVLLLLDAAANQITFRCYLSSLGFSVLVTSSASDSLRLLRKNRYEAILLDFSLPGVDRFEFLDQIKLHATTCPVVVITPPDETFLPTIVVRQGAADYISKSELTPERACHTLFNAIRLYRSEKQRLQAEENLKTLRHQLELVISNSPLNAWSCDSTGALTYLNGDAYQQLGIDSEKAIGRLYSDVFKDYPSIIDRFDKAMAGEQVQSVAETNGSFFKACYVPLHDLQGEKAGITGFAYDITDQVRYEGRLKKAKDMAEEILKAKEVFLTNISHEIRTPLNGIIGLLNILQKSPLNQDQQRYLNAIQSSSKNLMQILNDLLDIAKITANKISFTQRPFNLHELIQETLDLMEAEAHSRSNTLQKVTAANVPGMLVGDSLRLRQILLNLIGNAIKFTHKGFIRLTTRVLSSTESELLLQFSVEDSGVGIQPEHLHVIFESFNQGSTDTTVKYGGTGLGLSITKSLVELQGGQISVNSKPDEGSNFTFFLPYIIYKHMDNVENSDNQKDQSQIPPFEQMRILLAEDNEINQLLVNTVLEEWGCVTDTVSNGKEALAKLKTSKYDLILMDMQMPEMDGFEAIIKIRQSGAHYAKIPIIALTAHATASEVERCLATGADGYLSKPFEPEELHQNMVRLTTEYRSHSK